MTVGAPVRTIHLRAVTASVIVCLCTAPVVRAQEAMPRLARRGQAVQLVVAGEPMLILGGELGNSSSSSLDFMAPIWARLSDLGLNTVLTPVSWELIEPEEGRFAFELVDGLIEAARAHDLHLVLLWFGSWKNSMSSYAPAWVKRDPGRFARARRTDGTPLEILTPFSEANAAADARAFGALMGHLREVDGAGHTVVMVQIENEIGMIPEARDHIEAAERAFAADVPRGLLDYLNAHRDDLHPVLAERWTGTSGTWTDVFGEGPGTEEIFMAWYFGRYVERVATAGKGAYPLPMYVNAALVRPGFLPGAYPSAGPLPHLIDIWRAAAPSVDFLAPDIYFPNFVEWTRAYDRPGNPVFIPEAGRAGSPTGIADAFYAFGARDAIGFSPFSIEDTPEDHPLGAAYDALAQLAPVILEHQGDGSMAGFRPPVAFDGTVDEAPQTVRLGDYALTVQFVDPWTPRDAQRIDTHGGLVIWLGGDAFLVAGTGITITFATTATDGSVAGIERAEEGRFVQDKWRRGRVLNGDQTHQGRHVRLPPGEVGIQRVRLYRYH